MIPILNSAKGTFVTSVLLVAAASASLQSNAQVYNDNSTFDLVTANNGGQVRVRNAPNGSGNPGNIRNLANSAGLPAVVRDSRLTTGVYAKNITQMAAVKQTLGYLANSRPATYTGGGTVVTNGNLEQHRNAIKNNGGTFIFRGTVNITGKNKLIQVGANTTIWIDGTVRYTGPIIPGTVPDQFSVSDVINGIFEVRGTRNNAKPNVKIFGTKRGNIIGNDRVSAVFTSFVRDIRVEGLNTQRCRNVMFINTAYGKSIIKGNFIFDSTRRAIHLKATVGTEVTNNLIYDADVDGIDVDAFDKQSKVLRNVMIKSGSRLQVWTEIAVVDTIIDGNVGIHTRNNDGGFQENGSETGQPPTARNVWRNNHVFYANSTSSYRQGFSFHPNRVINRGSVTFQNNFVWQQPNNAHKENPKNNTTTDVSYYLGAPSGGGNPDGGSGGDVTPPSGATTLQVRHSGKCLDVAGGLTANGTTYHQWGCNTNNVNQRFVFQSRGNGLYGIKSERSNRCVDLAAGSTANGAVVHQWDCGNGNVNQSWKLVSKGGDWFEIVSQKSGKCLDVAGVSSNNGAKFHQWTCQNGQNQQYKFLN